MSQDLAGEVWMSAAENTGVYLLNLAIAEGAQNRMQFCQSQGLLHARLRTAAVKWQCRSAVKTSMKSARNWYWHR
jgi:hypothetical protein